VKVKGKVKAGARLKIRIRDLSVNKVKVTLGGKKLAVAKVSGGKVTVTKTVPKNLAGKKVLRVLDRDGEVLFKTTIKVVNKKDA